MSATFARIPLDDAVSTYVKLIRTGEALHAEVSRGLAAEGLTASQFSTLKVLRIHESLAQKDIATHLLKTGGNITVVVDNLERMALVRRERDAEDRRIVFVRLTPSGEELFDRIYPHHLARIRKAMAGLNAEEIDALDSLLRKLHPEVTDADCTTPEAAAVS